MSGFKLCRGQYNADGWWSLDDSGVGAVCSQAPAKRVSLFNCVNLSEGSRLPLIEARVRRLAADLRTALRTLPGVQVQDLGSNPCAIVTFTHAEIEAKVISEGLSALGMNTSITTPASTRIDATRRRLPEMVRCAPHYFNTEPELENLVAAIARLLADQSA